MKEYVFLDDNNIVIKIDYMDIFNPPTDFDFRSAVTVGDIRPKVGQKYNGLTNSYEDLTN
jgi:hypothetical protein